jgi:hypothetical protein
LALLFTALLAFTPAKAIAQAVNGPDQSVQGTVIGIDQPDGCLRICQNASSSSKIIGCAKMAEKLQLSGNYSSDGRWAELTDKSWVYAAQIDAPNKPKVQRQTCRSYESYDTEDSYPMASDTVVVYGSPYGYVPAVGLGFGFGPSRGRHGGNHHGGNHHGRC